MSNIRLPRAVCAVVNETLQGSHDALNALFISSGAHAVPNLAHTSKWKEWLYAAGSDPEVDSLSLLGGVLEEFMDVAPAGETRQLTDWQNKRQRVVQVRLRKMASDITAAAGFCPLAKCRNSPPERTRAQRRFRSQKKSANYWKHS